VLQSRKPLAEDCLQARPEVLDYCARGKRYTSTLMGATLSDDGASPVCPKRRRRGKRDRAADRNELEIESSLCSSFQKMREKPVRGEKNSWKARGPSRF
jgi:hypothetical protein